MIGLYNSGVYIAGGSRIVKDGEGAAAGGNKFLGAALIEKSADVNARNEDGETPLIVAAIKGQNDFTAMLIEKSADLNAVDNMEHSAMHYASEGGFTEIVEQLITGGAEN